MDKARVTAVYSAAHFAVDLSCAFLVLRFGKDGGQWLEAVLLYNFCAFALQMPLGLLTDRFGNGKAFSAAGCLLVAAAWLLRGMPTGLCVTAGIGNALFHIGGGHDVLALNQRRAGQLGVFVSPGAFGLFLGGLLSRSAFPVWPVLAGMVLAAGAILLLIPGLPGSEVSFGGPEAPKAWAGLSVLLLLVVVLRSYGGFLFSFPWKTGLWSWAFVFGVVLGKTLGGFFYDRLGGRIAALGSLIPAAALFLASGIPALGCLAVLLFNMTMPLTLRRAADLIPGAPGFSFGLLTFGLFLGFLPTWLDLPSLSTGPMYAGVCLLSLLLLLPALRRDPA